MNKLIFLTIVLLLVGCSNTAEVSSPSIPPSPVKVEHKYFAVGDTVEGTAFDFTINSVKVDNGIPAREGNKWIVLDVTFKDTLGNDDGYTKYASMYGEFTLIDDEKYIYKSYNKEQKTELYGTTRDFILFLVPASKKEFILFDDDYLFDDYSDLNDISRNIVRINLSTN